MRSIIRGNYMKTDRRNVDLHQQNIQAAYNYQDM